MNISGQNAETPWVEKQNRVMKLSTLKVPRLKAASEKRGIDGVKNERVKAIHSCRHHGKSTWGSSFMRQIFTTRSCASSPQNLLLRNTHPWKVSDPARDIAALASTGSHIFCQEEK